MSIHRTYNVRLRLDSHLHNRVTKVGLCIVPAARQPHSALLAVPLATIANHSHPAL